VQKTAVLDVSHTRVRRTSVKPARNQHMAFRLRRKPSVARELSRAGAEEFETAINELRGRRTAGRRRERSGDMPPDK
jgi:hypothetical protein